MTIAKLFFPPVELESCKARGDLRHQPPMEAKDVQDVPTGGGYASTAALAHAIQSIV